ncbi:PH domain-containing protein [Staphylococcus aureus]
MWRYFNWYHFIVYILIFLVFISVIRLLLQPIINYKYRFYRVNDRNVEVKKTFIFKKHQITKIERLQFLEIKSNPILKLLNLNILIFVTAGHELKLPIVSEEEMNQLSEDIFIALRGADSDV